MSSVLQAMGDPRCWYPLVRVDKLRPGRAAGVEFNEKHYVVVRDERGNFFCLDDACAHRKVALHNGTVSGCRVVCPYHGWEYDRAGQLVAIPHWPRNRRLPPLALGSYETRVFAGIVFFRPEPGSVSPPPPPVPDDLDRDEWFTFDLDRRFENHWAIGLVNGMDYFHFHLHRKYQPWSDISLAELERNDEAVCARYEVTSGRSCPERVLRRAVGKDDPEGNTTNPLAVHFHYPHHWADLGGGIKVWVHFRPESPTATMVFITMAIRARGWGRRVRAVYEPLFRRAVLGRIQAQDAWIGRLEQTAWERYPDSPRHEVNPVAAAAERLIRDRWDAYTTSGRPVDQRTPVKSDPAEQTS